MRERGTKAPSKNILEGKARREEIERKKARARESELTESCVFVLHRATEGGVHGDWLRLPKVPLKGAHVLCKQQASRCPQSLVLSSGSRSSFLREGGTPNHELRQQGFLVLSGILWGHRMCSVHQ